MAMPIRRLDIFIVSKPNVSSSAQLLKARGHARGIKFFIATFYVNHAAFNAARFTSNCRSAIFRSSYEPFYLVFYFAGIVMLSTRAERLRGRYAYAAMLST